MTSHRQPSALILIVSITSKHSHPRAQGKTPTSIQRNNDAREHHEQSFLATNKPNGRLRELQRERRCIQRGRRRRRAVEELRGVSPRQILQRGLSKGPPQQAQEGVQGARGRTEGRAVVRAGSREARRRLLPDMHAANTLADWDSFGILCLLHEENLHRVWSSSAATRDGRQLPILQDARSK